jgi:reverse gyrase
MSDTAIQKGKWVGGYSGDDYLWAYESTCKKCGGHTFTPLDSPRLKTGLCTTCYFDEKNQSNANQETKEVEK